MKILAGMRYTAEDFDDGMTDMRNHDRKHAGFMYPL